MSTTVGRMQVFQSARGATSYRIELSHGGLHKHRIIRGADPRVVQAKAETEIRKWEELWSKKRAAQDHREHLEEQRQIAEERTAEAQQVLDTLEHTLAKTLAHDDKVDWESLKDRTSYSVPRPEPPVPRTAPEEPSRQHAKYEPRLGLLDRIFTSRAQSKIEAAEEQFERDHASWQTLAKQAEQANEDATQQHQAAVGEWEERRRTFVAQQTEKNAAVDAARDHYLSGAPDAIVEYCDLVLTASAYPEFFPQEFEVDYNPDTRSLVVEYSLPSPDAMPTLQEVKYVRSRDDFTEKHLTASQQAKLYDSVIYQTTLRTIHELFEADAAGALDAMVLNGHVTSIDRGTGQETTACILSLQAKKDEFLAINLAQVDPKACFRQLKGVGSSKLHSVTPVAPIMRMRRDDGRFVSSYDVAAQLDTGYNLAAMDWEDFEHLIREVFEKEFSAGGGEVKVTRASRDGGVDAVVFDPDPIRGGKIAIQAKRYTNTVGVAAVRDLYGTVVNEGAIKGILVTTSDYGPDAYEFAADKPLTLMSGANLLHLLEKHGHRAKIDLMEARKLALGQVTN